MIALVIGTVLAIGALTFVLYPVFFGVPRRPLVPAAARRGDEPENERESAILALREIEFDRETGKLSDADYTQLKGRYTQQAIDAMRREDAAASSAVNAVSDADVEAAVRAYREQHAACPTCGPRPESDAIFCSTCGRYLRDRCAACGAPVDAPDARYCMSCGDRLAA